MIGINVIASFFVLLILVIAAVTDIRERVIPNILPVILSLGFVVFMAVSAEMREVAGYRFIAAALAFVFGLGFFSAGIFGGGDVKLFAALVLWHPLDQIGVLILGIGISGAIISIYYTAIQFAQNRRLPDIDDTSAAVNLKAALRTKVPYGAAILMGHMVVSFMSSL